MGNGVIVAAIHFRPTKEHLMKKQTRRIDQHEAKKYETRDKHNFRQGKAQQEGKTRLDIQFLFSNYLANMFYRDHIIPIMLISINIKIINYHPYWVSFGLHLFKNPVQIQKQTRQQPRTTWSGRCQWHCPMELNSCLSELRFQTTPTTSFKETKLMLTQAGYRHQRHRLRPPSAKGFEQRGYETVPSGFCAGSSERGIAG